MGRVFDLNWFRRHREICEIFYDDEGKIQSCFITKFRKSYKGSFREKLNSELLEKYKLTKK